MCSSSMGVITLAVGRDDVGRVEPAAEPVFDDCPVAAGAPEGAEGYEGRELEIGGQLAAGEVRGCLAFDEGQDLVGGGEDELLGHLVAGQADPLLPAQEVGARVEPDA